jgi:hypothetical protein
MDELHQDWETNCNYSTLQIPSYGIYTVSWWRGLWVAATRRAMPAVALLPAGSSKPDRSRGWEPDEERHLEEGTFHKIPLMLEAASSVRTWISGQMMLEMVHDRATTGVTRVVWTAAVLRCGRKMEKLSHYHFSWTVSFQKQRYMLDASTGDITIQR